jgi:serine/threonine-protein kinase
MSRAARVRFWHAARSRPAPEAALASYRIKMATHSLPILNGYELIERIGRGAGAIISLARETAGGRLVAIKHVIRETAEDERFIAQAENEFQVARQLENPYLRRCFDLLRVRKWLKTRELFLIMEHVDGERLEDQPPASLARILEIFRHAAEGLHAMHLAGFVHADIKPNNILLTRDGGLKIIDFGQSCPIGHVKQRIQGTPDYMAPEQVLRKTIDQRTDVFNLGATLYRVVTGKMFKTIMPMAPTAARKIELESQRGNQPPHELNPQIPVPLSKLISACCATAKEHRPADMRAVLSRLEVIEHVLTRHRTPRRGRAPRPERRDGPAA